MEKTTLNTRALSLPIIFAYIATVMATVDSITTDDDAPIAVPKRQSAKPKLPQAPTKCYQKCAGTHTKKLRH